MLPVSCNPLPFAARAQIPPWEGLARERGLGRERVRRGQGEGRERLGVRCRVARNTAGAVHLGDQVLDEHPTGPWAKRGGKGQVSDGPNPNPGLNPKY